MTIQLADRCCLTAVFARPKDGFDLWLKCRVGCWCWRASTKTQFPCWCRGLGL